MASKPIHPKVQAAGVGGSSVGGIVTAIFAVFHIAVSQPVAALITAVLTAVGAFLAGYRKSA